MPEKTKNDPPGEWIWWRRNAQHQADIMGRTWDEDLARNLFNLYRSPRAAAEAMREKG